MPSPTSPSPSAQARYAYPYLLIGHEFAVGALGLQHDRENVDELIAAAVVNDLSPALDLFLDDHYERETEEREEIFSNDKKWKKFFRMTRSGRDVFQGIATLNGKRKRTAK